MTKHRSPPNHQKGSNVPMERGAGWAISRSKYQNREGTLPKEMEYSEVINLPMPPGRVVTKTADSKISKTTTAFHLLHQLTPFLSFPPPMDPDPPNLPVLVMPDNSNQPSVLEDNPSNEELPPPTPILLPDGLKRVRRPNPKDVNSVSIEEGYINISSSSFYLK
jgi:hypothetical protein